MARSSWGHAQSPHLGQQLVTTGVVTQVTNNGFFMQGLTGDGNPETSDGLFVFTDVDFFDQDSLDLDTRPNVSLVAGFFDPLDALFSYEVADGQGFGSIGFESALAPEPATLAAGLTGPSPKR